MPRGNALTRSTTGRPPLVFMLLFTTIWCGVTGVFAGIVGYSFYRHWDAVQRYQPVEARITKSEVESSRDSDGDTSYKPAIEYEYRVDGLDYTSDQVAFAAFGSSSGGWARQMVRDHPVDSTVQAWYDPADPAEAVLLRDVPAMNYFLLLFLQPFLLVGIGVLGYTLALPFLGRGVEAYLAAPPQGPIKIPTWGRLTYDIGGWRVRQGSRWSRAIKTVAVGYGLGSFLSIFVVGIFLDGFDEPDPSVVGYALLASLGFGLFLGFGSLVNRPRHASIVLDTDLRQLRITSRLRDVSLPFDRIAGWGMQEIADPHPQKSSMPTNTAPLLVAVTTDGEVQPVHVFGANEDGRRLAAKTAEVFAAMSSRPLVEAPASDETPGDRPDLDSALAGKGLGDITRLAREVRDHQKRYADLV